MRCPICDAKVTRYGTKVLDHTTLHSYQCNLCGQVFTTYEVGTIYQPSEAEEAAALNHKALKVVLERRQKNDNNRNH